MAAMKNKPSSNVYTALLFVALAFLCVASGVMWTRNSQLVENEGEVASKSPIARPFHVLQNPGR